MPDAIKCILNVDENGCCVNSVIEISANKAININLLLSS